MVCEQTGDKVLKEPYQAWKDFAGSRLAGFPKDLELLVVNLALTDDLRKRIQLSTLAISLASGCLAPKFAMLHGCLLAFAEECATSVSHLEHALSTLRRDETSSLWPYDPPSAKPHMAQLRKTMLLTVELDVGRTLLRDNTLEGLRKSESCIRAFLQGAPGDTHRYWEAFSDLGEALMTKAIKQHSPPDVAEMQRILLTSQSFINTRIPAFQERSPEDFPKYMQFKSMTESFAHFAAKAPKRFNEAMHSSIFSGVGVEQRASELTKSKCWGCKKYMGSMKKCGGCHVAEYCTSACQRGHWPEHKAQCLCLTNPTKRCQASSVDQNALAPFPDKSNPSGAEGGDMQKAPESSVDALLHELLPQFPSGMENRWPALRAAFDAQSAEKAQSVDWLKRQVRRVEATLWNCT